MNCGKTTISRLGNIRLGRKKCDCHPEKVFQTQITREEFLERWTEENLKYFDLVDEEYTGRVNLYNIQCKKCGALDERYGITLEGTDIKCKSCELGSLGERTIAALLDEKGISYIREFVAVVKGRRRRYDFFIPELNTMIEFHGRQHYEYIPFFHQRRTLEEEQQRDRDKEEYCKQQGIPLIVIKYDEDIEEKLVHSLRSNDQA